MSNVKIETLTPVHIGSGTLLYENVDFVHVNIKKVPHIVIISEEKVWKLLGEQHLDNWLEAISKRENLSLFLEKYAPYAKSSDYAKRRIPLSCQPSNYPDTLKECIHNGMGLPYIPGSSIKGAIRTAILASFASTISDKENKIYARDKRGNLLKDRRGNQIFEAAKIEQDFFGKDPNTDVLRFLQVGDAYFEKGTEIATRLVNLNIRQSDDLIDKSKSQVVEAIGVQFESELNLKISTTHYNFAKENNRQIGDLPILTIGDLFRLINEHAKILVEDEIRNWSEIDKTGGDDYVEEMKKILQKINSCEAGKSCILRIGHASGWRFITGAWTEGLANFEDVVVPASRPNNRNYEDYEFPKTRRLDEDSDILGFVKLTV